MTDRAFNSSTRTVRTSDPDANAPNSRAHGFFWTVLAAAATVSITSNAIQALLHDTPLPVVAAAVAVIPPLSLLAAVHGVTVLARAHTAIRATRWVATAMTILIATGAFWLSFTALRSLAITAGIPRAEAWLWPVIIEGSMAQATVALLALAHSGHGEHGAHETNQANGIASPLDEEPVAVRGLTVQTRSVVAGSVHTPTPASEDAGRDFSSEAARLCARDPGRRRDPALVARALTHHYLDGWNPSRIATELNKSRSTISRIPSDAASLHAHDVDKQTVSVHDSYHRRGG
ncbi:MULTISPECIES: DUF2637 domain-containing protein [Nocardia]|uniref:DUF2637 domain-containing protein n=1 Tax=Nocardia TaxID=1817 RepID=UPI000D693308|nr:MULTISPECIES: DUF2637 domain-containing protein [Nocardia]